MSSSTISQRPADGEPTEDDIRLATLAAVKNGAKSDAEAVRNYREAERVIRVAIPYLHRTVQGELSDAQVQRIREQFADELTRLGVHTFDIHEIRRRAAVTGER